MGRTRKFTGESTQKYSTNNNNNNNNNNEPLRKKQKSQKGQIVETSRAYQTDQNDEICGLCGYDGELVCCDNCPSAFHQTCLKEQELPEGNWYCVHCCCHTCGVVVDENDPVTRKCSLCKHKYHKTCTNGEEMNTGENSVSWFCSQSCHKAYSELESRIGLKNELPNELSCSLLRCIDENDKTHSSPHFVALKAKCNIKLLLAIRLMEENFQSMVDEYTKIDLLSQLVYNRGSPISRLNCEGFYMMVLEKGDVLVSAASIRIHGTQLAELPFMATRDEFRNQGMCRRLFESIEEMLRSLNVEKLVLSSEPLRADMWISRFGFQHLDEEDRTNMQKINLMLLPGSVWLKKIL